MHCCSDGSLGTAPPLTAVRGAGVLGQETGEGNLCRRKREFICGDLFWGRSDEPPPSFCQQVGGGWGGGLTAYVSLPPSCSCCMLTWSSETSAEWRRSGCAVQCRSVERGESSVSCHVVPSVYSNIGPLRDMMSLYAHFIIKLPSVLNGTAQVLNGSVCHIHWHMLKLAPVF